MNTVKDVEDKLQMLIDNFEIAKNHTTKLFELVGELAENGDYESACNLLDKMNKNIFNDKMPHAGL